MFQTVSADGTPLTAADARARAGDGAAGRGDAAQGRLGMPARRRDRPTSCAASRSCRTRTFRPTTFRGSPSRPAPTNFLRNALKEGLAQEERLGVNPFKFGLVASTDTHLGAAGAVREDEFVGHGGAGAPPGRQTGGAARRHRAQSRRTGRAVGGGELARRAVRRHAAARGLRHQRAAHDRALLRRLGATPTTCASSADFVEHGYAGGVPMGGDLPAPPRVHARRRRFALSALRDPGGGEPTRAAAAPADRQGLGRGRRGARARLRRRRRRRATAPASTPPPARRTAPASISCARSGATPTSTRAARVLLRPRRWRTRPAAGAPTSATPRDIDCRDPAQRAGGVRAVLRPRAIRATIQERAWTSPIWYAPPAPRGAS